MYYETIFIVNPDVSQENTEQMTDEMIAKVEKVGGRIVKREYWGSRPLAYSIAKRKRGHYILLVTDGEPAATAVLENAIRLDERVLRFLTTKLTELSDEPSPLVRRKATATSSDEAESSDDKPASDDSEASSTETSDAPAAEASASEEAKVEVSETPVADADKPVEAASGETAA